MFARARTSSEEYSFGVGFQYRLCHGLRRRGGIVPLALRPAACPRLRVVRCGSVRYKFHGGSGAIANPRAKPVLRARLLDGIRAAWPGRKRVEHALERLPMGGQPCQRFAGHCLRIVYRGSSSLAMASA